jgi:hypothetical protein
LSGERNASMIRNAKRINQMVAEKGFEGTRDFLLQIKTVGELNKIAAKEGLKFDSGFLVDLGVIALDFGFILRFNVCSVIGFAIAYYLLRYFR